MPQGVYSTQLSMRSHVQQIVAGCFAVLRQLCSIGRFVPSSSCMGLIDTRLRSAVRLISGCLQPARLSGCQCSAMLHLLIYVVGQQLTVCLRSSGPIRVGLCMLRWCLWASTSVACILAPSVVRHDICRHSCAVERGLVVSFRGQPHYCCRPRCLEARFCHAWSLMKRFRTGQGPCHADLHKWGLAQSPSCDCGQRHTMNHIVDTCPLTKFEGGLNLLHEADKAVIWLKSTVTAAFVK